MSEEKVLTEKQALKDAEADGITFVDSYSIVNFATFETIEDGFDTREEAEKAFAKLKDQDNLTIQQSRSQVV